MTSDPTSEISLDWRVLRPGNDPGGGFDERTAVIRRRARRWALNGAAAIALLYILVPLVFFVTWLAFFRQEIPSFPPGGYSLKWFAAPSTSRSSSKAFA